MLIMDAEVFRLQRGAAIASKTARFLERHPSKISKSAELIFKSMTYVLYLNESTKMLIPNAKFEWVKVTQLTFYANVNAKLKHRFSCNSFYFSDWKQILKFMVLYFVLFI